MHHMTDMFIKDEALRWVTVLSDDNELNNAAFLRCGIKTLISLKINHVAI